MGVIWGLVRLLLHLLYLNHKTKEDQSSPIVKGSRDHLQRHQTMLHILSLFLLPHLLSLAEAKSAFLPVVQSPKHPRRAFLYLCSGEGCSGTDIVLLCLSVLFIVSCLVIVCVSCCKIIAKKKEKFQTETI